jgi:pyruvate/2-oxoglutarate dehydrogenase complex dihydrolipoamide acyltransferase (E2) component
MNYGMAVSNKDWRTRHMFRNVRDALIARGHKVRVITTDLGWPEFHEVDDVICRQNIEEHAAQVGLMEAPATMPAAAEEAQRLTPICIATDEDGRDCEACYICPHCEGPGADTGLFLTETTGLLECPKCGAKWSLEEAKAAYEAYLEHSGVDVQTQAGEQVGAGEPPAEPIEDPPTEPIAAPVEEARAEPELTTAGTVPFPASKAAVELAEAHGIALADVPHNGEKITLPNVKAHLASLDTADARDPD